MGREVAEFIRKNGKLPKKFKKEWLKALRSGKYKQGTGQLRRIPLFGTEPEYCCLGVACDLTGFRIRSDHLGNLPVMISPRTQKLPGVLRGGEGSNPYVPNPVADHLASMNDTPYTFEEIAEWIERNL